MQSKPRVLRVGNLTEEEKMQLYDKHKREPKLTQNQLAEWCRVKFSLEKASVQGTISNILRRFKKSPAMLIAPDRKSNRAVMYPELDAALAL
ncbi:putative HTH CENPB-type domain-containing protein [Phytophthora infestans]|uniref:Putative HTH CENPB-type domain-containing protein n=1 Tax=Phytophthora infestans TaxID=4787 RepID=A0A8S9U6I7_PHYIN|nr:putative HTH CENPB-type domain-containing protein [Phytophthora infestans]